MRSKWQEGLRLRGGLPLFLEQFLRSGRRKGKENRRLQTQEKASGGFVAWRNDYRGIILPFDEIAEAVSEQFELPLDIITSRRRDTRTVYARWFIIDFAHRFTHMSTSEIGWKLNKDHTTCLHANKHLRKVLDDDPELLYLYNTINLELEELYHEL
tara:strand:+ start:255 stop:722 length:468 start_codon:yes stop_codon:yes gene_type:complete